MFWAAFPWRGGGGPAEVSQERTCPIYEENEGPGAHPVTTPLFRREGKEVREDKGLDQGDPGRVRRCWDQDPGTPETWRRWG